MMAIIARTDLSQKQQFNVWCLQNAFSPDQMRHIKSLLSQIRVDFSESDSFQHEGKTGDLCDALIRGDLFHFCLSVSFEVEDPQKNPHK